VFGIPLKNVWRHVAHSFSREEAALAHAAITYWTNFAKTG
jgi:hypothetical protein